MGDVIFLDPRHARLMNDARGLLGVYKSRNIDGRYDTAVEKYKTLYKTTLKGLFATKESQKAS